jgi:hypothetical protein
MPGSLIKPAGGQIIKPGPDLVEAGRALQTTRRGFGVFPYQWMFPGPNAKAVDVNFSVPVPAPGNTVDIVPAGKIAYQVAEGMRFSLRGLAVGFLGTAADFRPGTNDTVFTLQVRTSAGNRNVEYFQDFSFNKGSTVQPWPVIGPLEFESLDTLVWTAANNATPNTAGNVYFGILLGYEYPLTEAIF